MAAKALLKHLDYIKKIAKGDFQIGVTAVIGYGTESYVTLTCAASAALLNPIPTVLEPSLQTWRERIRDAVIAAALDQYGVIVDGVVFNDLLVSSI